MLKSKIDTEKALYEQLKSIRQSFGNNVKIKLFIINTDVILVSCSRINEEELEEIGLVEEGDVSNHKDYLGRPDYMQ